MKTLQELADRVAQVRDRINNLSDEDLQRLEANSEGILQELDKKVNALEEIHRLEYPNSEPLDE
jgi:predicted  nucleic acid-binding Zn-ribbon protein